MLDESASAHRLRLEVPLQLYVTRIIGRFAIPNTKESSAGIRLPHQPTLEDWQTCIGYSEEIVNIFQYWDPAYFALVEPMISTTIWFVGCMLCIQLMYNPTEYSEAGTARLESALDLLCISLQQFANYWSIADMLLHSIKSLRFWTWLKVSFSDILVLLERLKTPHNPNDESPTEVSVKPIMHDG